MIPLQLLALLLPWRLRRALLARFCRIRFAPSARIGVSLVHARETVMGPHSRIGHFTLVRNLDRLVLGEYALIGNFNWITAPPKETRHFRHDPDRDPSLLVGDHAAITNRHLIDCSNRVSIGPFAILAGWGSQILTHAVEFPIPRQESAPVSIGRYCFIGTRCVLLKGSTLADHCVLAAGTVLATQVEEAWSVYGGVPAHKIADVARDAGYFHRTSGYVD